MKQNYLVRIRSYAELKDRLTTLEVTHIKANNMKLAKNAIIADEKMKKQRAAQRIYQCNQRNLRI